MCVYVYVLVAQSCPTLCDSMVYRSPGSSIHEIPQEKILEWFAIPFSGDLPNPGFEPRSPTLWADSLPSEPPGKVRADEGTCKSMTTEWPVLVLGIQRSHTRSRC